MIKDNRFYSHNGILIGNGDRILGRYDTQYDVTVTTDGNGTASVDKNRGHYGDIVNLSNTPNYHYAFDHYTINGTATTNSSFQLYSDTNVVAYFTRTAGNNDWYYDSARIEDRTLSYDDDCVVIPASQPFTIPSVDPMQYARQSWSNYGVCRLKFTGNTSTDATTTARRSHINLSIDSMAGMTHEDQIKFVLHDYFGAPVTFTNAKFALVINFNARTAKLYINDNLVSTYNLTMQCNGCFLALSKDDSTLYEPLELHNISMKIFEEESDALAFARFQ